MSNYTFVLEARAQFSSRKYALLCNVDQKIYEEGIGDEEGVLRQSGGVKSSQVQQDQL